MTLEHMAQLLVESFSYENRGRSFRQGNEKNFEKRSKNFKIFLKELKKLKINIQKS